MTVPAGVLVVEPNTDHHERILAQFAEAESGPHRFELTKKLPRDRRTFALAVNATTATHRRSAIETLLDTHDVDAMILEKVLFQTRADLDAVGELLTRHDTSAWVNYGRRTYPGYQEIEQQLDGSAVDIEVAGHNLGLASNAVHFLDLAEYLNRSNLVSIDLSGLAPGSRPAHRDDCVEIFGTITATLANGSSILIKSLDIAPVQVVVRLTSESSTTTIDELQRTIRTDGLDANVFVAQNVSETPEIYEDAALGRAPSLTPYSDSARQHHFFLRALCEHLGIADSTTSQCPIS